MRLFWGAVNRRKFLLPRRRLRLNPAERMSEFWTPSTRALVEQNFGWPSINAVFERYCRETVATKRR